MRIINFPSPHRNQWFPRGKSLDSVNDQTCLETREKELVQLLESQTGLHVEVDRFVASQYPFNNGSCCRVLGPDSTDVYMHFVDPSTNDILHYNHPTLQRHVTGKRAASNIKYTLSSGTVTITFFLLAFFHSRHVSLLNQENVTACLNLLRIKASSAFKKPSTYNNKTKGSLEWMNEKIHAVSS